jgi:hypothetical protein
MRVNILDTIGDMERKNRALIIRTRRVVHAFRRKWHTKLSDDADAEMRIRTDAGSERVVYLVYRNSKLVDELSAHLMVARKALERMTKRSRTTPDSSMWIPTIVWRCTGYEVRTSPAVSQVSLDERAILDLLIRQQMKIDAAEGRVDPNLRACLRQRVRSPDFDRQYVRRRLSGTRFTLAVSYDLELLGEVNAEYPLTEWSMIEVLGRELIPESKKSILRASPRSDRANVLDAEQWSKARGAQLIERRGNTFIYELRGERSTIQDGPEIDDLFPDK